MAVRRNSAYYWCLVNVLMCSPQAFPEGLASFVLIGELRPRRPSKVWTARSRLVPPNPLQWSSQTTRARRPARRCSPGCISHPIEGTQDPSHSRHSASGKGAHQKKKSHAASDVWGFLKWEFKLSHSSIMRIFCVGAHQYSGQNNLSPYSHLELCCVPPVADVRPMR